jgi:hypothetical protein
MNRAEFQPSFLCTYFIELSEKKLLISGAQFKNIALPMQGE